jgi:hypothetical protein
MPTTRTTRPALTSTHTATLDIIWRSAQADDWLLGFTGPRQEAEEIKARIGHGRTRAARFLGYDIVVMHADHKHDHRGHRSINGGDRAESADRGHPRQVRALPASRQTDPTHGTNRRYGFQYRRPVPSRVPGSRTVLQTGVQLPRMLDTATTISTGEP